MKKLKIDPEFQSIIPPLTDDELQQLKENILADGCREAIVIWNNIIVDGHNRYKICTENNIPFKTEDMNFSDREDVIEWMLRNQLGRRNLNDFQRNEIALKYQEIIAKKMKERQIKAASKGGKAYSPKEGSKDMTKWSEPSIEPTTQRKELSKIAGTSEGSIQRSKLILENGTPEQIKRARKGGKGNSISAIANEIMSTNQETKMCSRCKEVLTLANFYFYRGKPRSVCKVCHNADKYYRTDIIRSRYNKKGLPPELAKLTKEDIIGDLYNVDKVIVHTVDDLIRDFTVNFDTFLGTLRGIIEIDKELLKDEENNKKMAAVLSDAVTAMEKMKGDYINE